MRTSRDLTLSTLKQRLRICKYDVFSAYYFLIMDKITVTFAVQYIEMSLPQLLERQALVRRQDGKMMPTPKLKMNRSGKSTNISLPIFLPSFLPLSSAVSLKKKQRAGG